MNLLCVKSCCMRSLGGLTLTKCQKESEWPIQPGGCGVLSWTRMSMWPTYSENHGSFFFLLNDTISYLGVGHTRYPYSRWHLGYIQKATTTGYYSYQNKVQRGKSFCERSHWKSMNKWKKTHPIKNLSMWIF